VRNKLDEWKIVGTLKQAGGTDLRKPEDTVGMSEIPEEEKQHQVPEILSEGHWLKRRRVFTNLPELNGRRLVDIDGAIKFDQNLESPYHSTFSEPTEAIRRPAQVFARPYPIRSMSIGLDDDFYSN
jgi:hypothetical protein